MRELRIKSIEGKIWFMTERVGFKYGLLIAPEADQRTLSNLPQLAPDLHWKVGKVEKLVTSNEVKAWKESFGRFRWDEITGESLLVYCVRESQRANVIDAEHEDIGNRLGRVLRPKEDGRTAHFYTVVSRDTLDQEYAAHRQRFLAEQGYAYTIVDADDVLSGG